MKKIIFLFLLILPSILRAEITNCNGEWTNKPCDGKVEARFEEVLSEEKSNEDLNKEKKQLFLNQLEILRFKAKKEHNLEFGTLEVNEICNDINTTLEDCRTKAQTKIDEINNKINELKISQNENNNKNETKEDPISVTVTENRIIDTGLWLVPNQTIPVPTITPKPIEKPEQPITTPKPLEPLTPTPKPPSYGLRK